MATATASTLINQAIQSAVNRDFWIVDARSFSGQQVIDQTVVLPAHMTVLLGRATFVTTITNGSPAWLLNTDCTLSGLNSNTILTTSPNAVISAQVTNAVGGAGYFWLSNMQIGKNNGATVTQGLVWVKEVFVPSYIRDLIVLPTQDPAGAGCTGILLENNPGDKGLGPIDVINCWVDGQLTPGAGPLVHIRGVPGGGYINFRIAGGALEHAGPGKTMLLIDGGQDSGGTGRNVITHGRVDGVYLECSNNSTTGIHLRGAQHICCTGCGGGGPGGGGFPGSGSGKMILIEWGQGGASASAPYDNTFVGMNAGSAFRTCLSDTSIDNPPLEIPYFVPFYHQTFQGRIDDPAKISLSRFPQIMLDRTILEPPA